MLVGQKIGPFMIEKEVGAGAMGQVFRARYIKTGQRVALKVMAPGTTSSTALARFHREAEVLKQLSHPNIVRFYVASEYQGRPYYAMEYIQGESLDQLLERRGKLPWNQVVELGKQVCSALAHAHEKGIIHRDLKPSNLMMTAEGIIKLTDFGIAKDLDVTQLTATNNTVGTASYMSPEQCKGERNLSHKSDLYSLGVVLYELLVGEKPFHAETTMDMFLAHVQGTFERPARKVMDIPVWLDNLVCQLLEKKPEQRPFDAAMVSEALERVAEKVEAQSSAGVDAARARSGTARADDTRPEGKDREAARTLLDGSQKKRRRRKKKRSYEQTWVKAFGLMALLAGIGFMLYEALKPPSPGQLFREAQKVWESGDADARREARTVGPIEKYLRLYGNSQTEYTEEVKRWANEIDQAQREVSLNNRKKLGLAPDGPAEAAAQTALALEAKGELDLAKERWLEVMKAKEQPDFEDRPLLLVAEKHLRDLAQADLNEIQLQDQVTAHKNLGKYYVPSDESERLATEAIRFANLGDNQMAQSRWRTLAMRSGKDPKLQFWLLLAGRKLRDLEKQTPVSDDKKNRLSILDAQLAQAVRHFKEERRPLAARAICLDINNLYAQDQDLQVQQRIAEFHKLLNSLPPE